MVATGARRIDEVIAVPGRARLKPAPRQAPNPSPETRPHAHARNTPRRRQARARTPNSSASLRALLAGEPDFVACAANTAALLYWSLPGLNWAGFYLRRAPVGRSACSGRSRASPPACASPIGKGVCGTAAARRETVVVADVHAFPGHIACDSASNSEVVVPILDGERLIGVLDLDSPLPGASTRPTRAGSRRWCRCSWNPRGGALSAGTSAG